MIDPAKLSQQVEAGGFYIIPALISSQEVEELLSALDCADVMVTRSRGVRNLASKVPAIVDLAASSPIRQLVDAVLGSEAALVRSILFDKLDGLNWSLPWHQDVTIAVQRRIDVVGYGPWSVKEGVHSVQPPKQVLERMISVRVHLDDCGVENGALQVIAGSHQAGKLSAEARDRLATIESPVICSTSAGGGLVMRPLLLHSSGASRHSSHRRVVHLDFAAEPLTGGLDWSRDA